MFRELKQPQYRESIDVNKVLSKHGANREAHYIYGVFMLSYVYTFRVSAITCWDLAVLAGRLYI